MKKLLLLFAFTAIYFCSHAQTIPVQDSALLDVSKSFDADGSIVKFQWTQISGTPTTIVNANTSIAIAKFTVAGVYDYQISITDNRGATTTGIMEVTVNEADNIPPTLVMPVAKIVIKLSQKK